MSTPNTVKAQIQSLIDSANMTTGNTDADLTTAVQALISGFGQAAGGSSLPDGFNVFTLTLTERYQTSAEGWELVIPHGLGVVPKSAIVMRMGVVSNASLLRGWIGNDADTIGENIRFTNTNGMTPEGVSLRDSAAKWIYADDTNLYCRSGGWGGTLEVGCILLVGVMA